MSVLGFPQWAGSTHAHFLAGEGHRDWDCGARDTGFSLLPTPLLYDVMKVPNLSLLPFPNPLEGTECWHVACQHSACHTVCAQLVLPLPFICG